MKPFSIHTQRHQTPKIVMLMADADSSDALRRYCLTHGFDITKSFSGRDIPPSQFDFHMTLFASKNVVPIPPSTVPIRPITAHGVVCGRIGPSQTPCIMFPPIPEILDKRQALIDLYGVEPTYPNFIAHVSLSYARQGPIPQVDWLPQPPPVTFDRLSIEAFVP